MKKVFKSALFVIASALALCASIAPAAVSAWGDSDGGRQSYTRAQIDSGVLGDKIVLNSISNGVIGDEKNFVGARLDNGNNGASNVWNGNEITVEDGKTYIVRLYVHNNNPNGTSAVATGVKTTFNVPETVGSSVEVNGFIDTDNATPSKYWDNIVFKSSEGSAFYLDYVEGSALLENNGIGKNGGVKLSDNIVSTGVTIGYDALDGKIPGCFQYANYVTIKVKAVFTETYTVQKQVRLVGTTEWKESLSAKVGDQVEYQIAYKNTSSSTETGVTVKDVLPKNLTYISGTTKLYNAGYPSGLTLTSETLFTDGINIGSYTAGSNAYVRFTAKVVDSSLSCGDNTLVNWAQVSVKDSVIQDSADVVVSKTCPTPTPDPTPDPIPETGLDGAVSGAIGAGAIVTAAGYYIASRKQRA